jgi:excisionase family DNA binding protein
MMIIEELRNRRSLLTSAEVCKLLGIHRETLYTWLKEYRFPAGIRVGRSHRFDPGEVCSWLEARQQA